jgi:hypothetical protein
MAFKPLMKKSQNDWLLDHFKRYSSISGQEAASMFRIRSLPRRIMDLKAIGHRFSHEEKYDTTGQKYIRYHYLGQAQKVAA